MMTTLADDIRAGTHAEEPFFQSLERLYGASREEIIAVTEQLGLVKTQIRSFFEVQDYLKKKGLTHTEVTTVSAKLIVMKKQQVQPDSQQK